MNFALKQGENKPEPALLFCIYSNQILACQAFSHIAEGF